MCLKRSTFWKAPGRPEVRRDTLRSDLHRWIRKHPGDWEKIAPDTYRYTRYENANEPKVV